MNRDQLDHVLRAASQIIGETDLLVVGSAAILGSFDERRLPLEATRSDEADLAPFDDPDGARSMSIEGALGQGSQFHETYGYYADGVDVTTAIAPDGWRERLVTYQTRASEPGRGLCLEPHDLAISKLVAGRQKDLEFVGALLDVGLLDAGILRVRLDGVPMDRATPAFVGRARRWLASRDPS